MIRTVLPFIFRQFGPLCMIYLSRISVSKKGPDKMRCGADLRCGSEYSDKMRSGPKPKILNIRILCKALRIYCGSTAGPLILAGPLFISASLQIYCIIYCGLTVHRCFFADLLRIYCGPTVYRCFFADLLRIYCGLTVHRCFFADLLRIYCGPTVYRCFFADLLRARCTLQAHCLKVVLCGFTAGRCF